MRIDAHQHYWVLARGDYGWLGSARPALNRDFLPPDLTPDLTLAGIAGTILVQAARTIAETEFLLSLACREPSILGVVGWVDATESGLCALARFARERHFVGIRLMAPAEPDPMWLAGDALSPILEALAIADRALDLLVLPVHLPALRIIAQRHPGLRMVINHAGKPDIAQGQPDKWAADMARLAEHPNLFCKLSGLTAVCGPGDLLAQMSPYVAALVAMFGAERLIWGSDWPVLNESATYRDWLWLSDALLAGLTVGARRAIHFDTAMRVYRLHPNSTAPPASSIPHTP